MRTIFRPLPFLPLHRSACFAALLAGAALPALAFPTNPDEILGITAAGDTFTGYLLAGILVGKNYADAMRSAAKAASLAVAAKGAAVSIPRAGDLW